MIAVEVAVPRPVPATYTYEAPRSLLEPGEATLPPGTRVRVPFGPGELTGVVLGPAEAPRAEPGQKKVVLKTVRSRFDDPLPPLPEDLLALARRLAEVTVCPLGLVVKAMLPASAPPGRMLRTAEITTEGSARLREPHDGSAGTRAESPERGLPRLSEDDRRILTLLAVSRGPVPLVRIRRELGLSPGRSFARLEREGFVVIGAERLTPDAARAASRADAEDPAEPEEQAPSLAPPLTAAQRGAAAALEKALDARTFAAFLLDGVTGSGKTEVYFQAIAACLETGRSALLLVPEIALASQQETLLRARFGPGIAVFHSGLGAAERRAAFWRIRRGEARIVLGARSAVLAPIQDLGLVILDEEHDAAYKQDEAPRYHARQAAWLRARAAGAAMVLGSATPSLEAAHAAERNVFTHLRLPHRIAGRALPEVEIVDMRPLLRAYYKDPARDPARGPLILAPALEAALRDTVAAGQQALVLLNRRGYGGRMGCLQCGEIIECRRCGVAYTLHRRGSLAVCHACGTGMAPPEDCPGCGGDVLRSEGFGTERVEEEVSRLLPDVRIARFDRDTTRARGSHARTLDAFRKGAIRVLVGTQMIAKGHDFPAVTLVGVVAADGGLGAADFRAAERTFQLLTQVAGRAGRGEHPGRVLIQTMKPDHYAVSAAAGQDYPAFAAVEREMRRRFRYPPFVRLTSLTVSARTSRKAEAAATALARKNRHSGRSRIDRSRRSGTRSGASSRGVLALADARPGGSRGTLRATAASSPPSGVPGACARTYHQRRALENAPFHPAPSLRDAEPYRESKSWPCRGVTPVMSENHRQIPGPIRRPDAAVSYWAPHATRVLRFAYHPRPMVKVDLINRAMAATDLSAQDARDAVEALFEGLRVGLEQGNRVVLRRFGVFHAAPRKTGVARNPRTGEPVGIPRGRVVRFRPGQSLRNIS